MFHNTNKFCVYANPHIRVCLSIYSILWHMFTLWYLWTRRTKNISYRKETIWDLREYVFFFGFFFVITKHERLCLALRCRMNTCLARIRTYRFELYIYLREGLDEYVYQYFSIKYCLCLNFLHRVDVFPQEF